MTKPRQAGFALPAVLGVTTILTLIFLVAMLALKSLHDEAFLAADSTRFQRDALSGEAHFLYAASTEPLAQTGLLLGGARQFAQDDSSASLSSNSNAKLIFLDDQPYRWSSSAGATPKDYQMSAQDLAGLINLSRVRPDVAGRLFQLSGVSSTDASLLSANILARAIGLSSTSAALDFGKGPLAPGKPLLRRSELLGLPNWSRTTSTDQWRRTKALTTLQPDILGYNINTAPPDVLEAWFGISKSQAQAAVVRRRTKPLLAATDIGAAPLQDEATFNFPNGRFRFTLVDPRTGSTYRSEIILTPHGRERPFWIQEAELDKSEGAKSGSLNDLEPFPDLSGRAADR